MDDNFRCNEQQQRFITGWRKDKKDEGKINSLLQKENFLIWQN